MKQLFTYFLLLSSLNLFAQSTKIYNDVNAKTRPAPSGFTKLSVSSGIELFLTQGNETALAVSVSDAKYDSRLKTEVENGVLKIYYDNNGITWKNDRNAKLKVYLSCATLEDISGSGGARITIADEFNFNILNLSFSSGATFTGKIQARSVTSTVSSGAFMTPGGVVSALTVSANSGAMFNGYELMTETCKASANSGASVKVTVQKELTATANSGGQILYKGNGTVVKKTVHSGGIVKAVK
jgi:Putative auto-transporter adhesin, head GIN domain